MMTKKVSFIVLSGTGNRVKQFSVPSALFIMLLLAGIVGLSLFSVMLYNYPHFRRSIAENGRMSRKLADQGEEVVQQRKQIQSFAHDIDALKDRLIKLSQFEEKMRVIANLEPGQDQDALFGVGGAAPEDLDSRVGLTERHQSLMREMHRQINELETASLHQESRFDGLLDKLEDERSLLASTPSIRPVKGFITSGFGYRISPFTGGREFHKGLDIANRKGTKVHATADGVISFAGRKGTLGFCVVIDHGHGLVTEYAHLSKILKKRGDKVKRGDIVGQIGSTGRSTGPHLHYEVHLNGVPVNPSTYVMN
jgi:murein DD-endopeptidase MepM/ murein hydrolase activator NlpD